MDISGMVPPEQEHLFYALAPAMFGNAVLVSHAIVNEWDHGRPITLSRSAIGRLRTRLPDTLLVTDDMQMQGLQKAFGTEEASLQSLIAGMDMLCIGNNLLDQEQQMLAIADRIEREVQNGLLNEGSLRASVERVRSRKSLLARKTR